MVNQQKLYIAFDGHQVVVQSNAYEVLAELRRTFREMLEPEPTLTVGRLEVWQKDEKYLIVGDSETRLEYRSLTDVLARLRDKVALHLMQSRPDLLWLHAGAVAYQDCAVIIPGGSGRGKSTLATRLCTQGWAYLSDDIVPLDPSSGQAIPFLQTPRVRQVLGQEIPGPCLRRLRKTEVNLKPETICREIMPIGVVVFPSYRTNYPTRLLPCSPATATLELLENCLNFVNHREAAVGYLANLAKRVPAFHLTFNSSHFAAELITQAYENKRLFGQAITK